MGNNMECVMTDRRPQCPVCGEHVDAVPWVILNRYVVGTGENSAYTSFNSPDGEYLWEPGQKTEAGLVSGPRLHWPDCAIAYVEGQMVEVDFVVKEDRDG